LHSKRLQEKNGKKNDNTIERYNLVPFYNITRAGRVNKIWRKRKQSISIKISTRLF
jgi:hypothetical protein